VTAVLAAVARAVLEAVLVLAAVASVFWAATGPQDFRTLARLAVMFVTITGAVLGVSALQPKGDHDG
jgi:hypothetical protein